MWARYPCCQCGYRAPALDMPYVELHDGTFLTLRVCRNKDECRRRWWAEFAYKMALSQA